MLHSFFGKPLRIYLESSNGHCGFRSLANQIYLLSGCKISHKDIRKQAFEYFLQKAFFKDFFDENDYNTYVTNHREVIETNNISDNSCGSAGWIDNYLLQCVSELKKVTICVFSYKSIMDKEYYPSYISYDGNDCIGACNLLHWGKHYDTILVKPDTKYNEEIFEHLLQNCDRRGNSSA